jgi:hypothetical protein
VQYQDQITTNGEVDMSAKLEPHGVYLLANALGVGEYAVLEAVHEQDQWYVVECHAAPFGSDPFRQRTALPPEQQLRFLLAADGVLLQRTATGTWHPSAHTLTNLSLMGYLRDGTYVGVAEQTAAPADEA